MSGNCKEKLRLDKFLASQNFGSRKQVAELIKKGRVSVNDTVVKLPDAKVMPSEDIVSLDGKHISYNKYIYIMLNKPAGVLSASRDKNCKTVLDLVPESMYRRGLFPAGRLDKDTTGLLIITDDGEFAHNMLSPKKHVYKRYEAKTERPVVKEDIKIFEGGITYKGTSYAPGKLEILDGEYNAAAEVMEGKFHQVKRMFEYTGNKVIKLNRVRIGKLYLDPSLHLGECILIDRETAALALENSH